MSDSLVNSEGVLWDRPIFIVSSGRSGSVYLTHILNQHTELALTYESNMATFFKFSHQLATAPEQTPGSETLLDSTRLIPELYRPLFGKLYLNTMIQLWREFYVEYFSDREFKRWGDNIVGYWAVPDLIKLFPEAQFIHLIRDGRDRTASALQHRLRMQRETSPTKLSSFEEQCRYWSFSNGEIAAALRDHPHVLVVRYEALVREPEKEARNVFQFLGVVEEDAVVEFIGNKDDPTFSVHGGSASPEESIGRWRRDFTPPQRLIAQTIMGEMLLEFGYDAE